MASFANVLRTLVALVALPSAAMAQTQITVGMASGVNQVPSLVAAQQGFFKEEGLDVQIKPVVRGNLEVEAIVAGSMQFAEVSDVVLFSAGSDRRRLTRFTGKMVGSPNLGEVKFLADLKGKRIGMQVGTGVHGVFLNLIKKEGLSESDFQVSNVRVTGMPTAMAYQQPLFKMTDEAAAYAFTIEMLEHHAVSDRTLAEARSALGDRGGDGCHHRALSQWGDRTLDPRNRPAACLTAGPRTGYSLRAQGLSSRQMPLQRVSEGQRRLKEPSPCAGPPRYACQRPLCGERRSQIRLMVAL